MKILALSDEVVDALYSPRLKQAYADVDLVLACGDLPFDYLEFIVNMLDAPLYYVPGNHDKPLQYLSDGRTVHQAEGCTSLDGVALRASAFKKPPPEAPLLAGLGGSLRYNQEPGHQYTQREMQTRLWRLTPPLLLHRLQHGRAVDIFLSHAAPRGIHDGADYAHQGFEAFRRAMERFRPTLWLHGHTHVYRRDVPTQTSYHQTTVVNVYPYRVLEWNPG